MKKFNYKKWVVENKYYGKQPLNEFWGIIAGYVANWLYDRLSDYYGSGNPLDWFGGMEIPPPPPFGMPLDDVKVIASTNGNFENPENPEELYRVVMKYKHLTPYADAQTRGDMKMIREQEDKDQYGRTQADRDWEQGINPKTDKKSTAQNSPSQEEKVKVSIDGEKTDVTINYKPGSNLQDVQISWGEESHTVDFEYDDTMDDHGNEGMDTWFTAESEDGKWKFGLEVYVEASFHNSGNIGDWDWNSLEIEIDDSKKDEPVDEARGPSGCPPVSCRDGLTQHPDTCKCVRTSSLMESKLKKVIKKHLRKLNEQTQDQCESLQSHPSFPMCCENAIGGNPPNPQAWWEADECTNIFNTAASMGLNQTQLENCCKGVYSTGCEVTLPASHPSCVKCFSNQAQGSPVPPGGAAAGAPGSGDNCECCEDDSGEDPCSDKNTAHAQCFWCRQENNPTQTCSMVGANLGYALSNNIPLFSDINDCHAQTSCNGPGEDPEIKCQCCDKHNQPVSMVQTVPSTPGCSVLNNPPNFTNCQTHPLSGGTPIKCKTLPGPIDDFPVGLSEMVKALGYIK